ncbi:MAG: low-specificity L-threonine aldolase [Bacteroidota bacterium]
MSAQIIDLRSDTVTKPSLEMRRAIAEAEVGDDVFGEDPTVNRLQERVAELLGKEAALFVPSGVMGNQVSLKVHTQPGDEVILEYDAHIFNYETVAPSILSGIQLHPIPGANGVLTAEQIARAIRPKAYYMPRTRVIALENTHNRAGGTIYPLGEIQRIRELAEHHGIRMHLDGARLWNASVATGIPMRDYARYFDSVLVCFSKGLGAPVGSAIAGSKEFIAEARRYRKIFGGGMRQVGILAAAALYAIDHNVERLREDHEKARVFAEAITKIPAFSIDLSTVQTNIVIFGIARPGLEPDEVITQLAEHGVLLSSGRPPSAALRAVMHMDVTFEQVQRAAEIVQELFS